MVLFRIKYFLTIYFILLLLLFFFSKNCLYNSPFLYVLLDTSATWFQQQKLW